MDMHTVITGVLTDDETNPVAFSQVCQRYQITNSELIELLEQGLIPEITKPSQHICFDAKMVRRIEAARRLQMDLDVNLAGVVLALELYDELERLRCEVNVLRRHVSI